MACINVCPLASELSVINSNIACPEEGCGKVFKASSALNMHLTKHHRNSCLVKRDTSVTVRYFCPEEKCVYHVNAGRHFTQMKYLKQHYLKVHSEKRYSCQSCNKAFATQELLKHHFQVCGIKFTCSCGNSYSSYEALLTHSKRKQHSFDDKFKSGYKRTKSEGSIETLSRKEAYCFSVDMMQPIYILPKPITDRSQSGLAVSVLPTPTISEFCNTESIASVVQDKSMQTDPVEPRRRKNFSQTKNCDKTFKRKASAQTQTGGILKKCYSKKTAETQTMGDYILKKAMADANILTPDVLSSSQSTTIFRKRKNNSGTQTLGRKTLKQPSENSYCLNRQSSEEQDNLPLSPRESFCLKKDIGLPDLWVADKITSSTQTGPTPHHSLLHSGDLGSDSNIHSDLNLDLFGQDGSLCSSSNLQSIFEDNSDSFDNVVNNTSSYEAASNPQSVNSLHDLTVENYTTCNVTQTDQNLNHLFPRHTCDDENQSSFAMRTTTETQTTDDLADLDSLLYTNMWTQTSGDSLFSDLDFADIQTQTAWPQYGHEEETESILVSAETQTAISCDTFDSSRSVLDDGCWSNELSHIETQTSEEDLKEFMAELE